MVDDAFGYWLSGFTDGEGCFSIHKMSRYLAYRCRFHINLRDDDIAVLQRIQQTLGVGQLQRIARDRRSGTSAVRFAVESKGGCLTLCHLFNRYPLQSKKANDFAVWREAVQVWRLHRLQDPDWNQMGALYQSIRDARKYIEGVTI
jgi:hypothetical protein